MLSLYKSPIRPKLEYSVQAWRAYLRKDIDLLEKVQRRATKLMFRDKSVKYYERLRYLNLTALETGRLRGDLIEVFKTFRPKGFEDVG